MTIALGEVVLLEAIRDLLWVKMGLRNEDCDIEFDEQPPSIAGQTYICIIPDGVSAGPTHNTAGRIHDIVHGVKITVLERCGNVARDRNRSVFMRQLTGINARLDAIVNLLDWNPNLLAYTNTLLEQQAPGSQPFIEMLRLKQIDARPKMVSTEVYAAEGFQSKGARGYTAMARSAMFGGARRIQTLVQTLPDPLK